MSSIKLIILGKPIGKGRPRLGRYGTYTPPKTVNYETLVKLTFMDTYKNFKPMQGAIAAKITAVFTVPQSYSKKKKEEALRLKAGYPHKSDIDNIIKIILDSLNGLAYIDDAQVVEVKARKEYGEQALVCVELEEVVN